MPVVHGWATRDGGEYSMVSSSGGRLTASRDEAGTRPLYASRDGRWVASDHRFFPGEEADLVPPGVKHDVVKGTNGRASGAVGAFRGCLEEAGKSLAEAVDQAVRLRTAGMKRVAVAFSGGLDSSVVALCAGRRTKVLAVTVASKGSVDSRGASQMAELLGAEHVLEEVDQRAVRGELRMLDLPFEPSPMDRSLWCVYSMAARVAAEGGADVILLGQLADELFGGYRKYQVALAREGPGAAASMMREGVLESASRGFVRDEAACCRWLEPRFPFADGRVLRLAKSFPMEFKVSADERKAVLREAARQLGVPEAICAAPKKAAQYSSGVQKLVG